MAKKKGARTMVNLECTSCHEINYHSEKNKTKTTERLELNKYCPHERKMVLHKETK